jgi:hypothetical protein
MAFRTVRISDVEPIAVVNDSLRWHPLRYALGVTGFGVNAYSAPTAGDDVVEEHREGDETGGHQELYVVLSGRARFTIDGEQVDAPAGTCDGSLLYNLACCEARLGRLDDATAHLREALDDEPRVREWGATDADLDALRERPDFPL